MNAKAGVVYTVIIINENIQAVRTEGAARGFGKDEAGLGTWDEKVQVPVYSAGRVCGVVSWLICLLVNIGFEHRGIAYLADGQELLFVLDLVSLNIT